MSNIKPGLNIPPGYELRAMPILDAAGKLRPGYQLLPIGCNKIGAQEIRRAA